MPPLDPRDPALWSDWARQWHDAQRTWTDWWQKSLPPPASASPSPAAGIAQVNQRFQAKLAELWRAVFALPSSGGRLPDIAVEPESDRRFRSEAWREQPFYSLLRQSYLLYADYLRELAALAPLTDIDRRRLAFATRQYLDAVAPTNFAGTNPDVLAQAIKTQGASLVQGLRNLADDARKGRITMTDERAFGVGRNIAVTPGSVVFRNELMELIQYVPTTRTVYTRPLVIVPPCINKYYILDLAPENSFVAHAVAQGHTVFIVSWRNIPPELGRLTWDDYIERGALTALEVAREITASKTVNALGFCVGGTILACALAVLAARRQSTAASATLLTTMLDFADPGEIGVYVSEQFLASREAQFMAGQRVRGGELANAFASLRANELVWNYVVRNYMKGETPPAFDLLYWNGDSANLPGPMYTYYLRNMYLANRLRERNALTMAGVRIDLAEVRMPMYVMASREDHIVPWRSAYATTSLVDSDVTFVLAASGHVAGVINPPQPPRRNYWVNDLLTDSADDWLERAELKPGSWWPHWYSWLAPFGGRQRDAPRKTGSAKYPSLDPAPGTYVREPA